MSEPQDDVSWWGRRLHQAEQEARQAAEEAHRAERLASAIDAPVEDWAQARETLGVAGKGLDAAEQHAGRHDGRWRQGRG